MGYEGDVWEINTSLFSFLYTSQAEGRTTLSWKGGSEGTRGSYKGTTVLTARWQSLEAKLCAEIFLSVYLGFWLHPTERLWWVKKVSSWSRSTAAAKPKENCSAVTEAIEGHCWYLCSCLKGCSFTFKLSSPPKYWVIGVEERNLSALPSQKLLESPFHLIVLNYSLYWFFSPFDLLIVKHTWFKEKKRFWSHNSTRFCSLH